VEAVEVYLPLSAGAPVHRVGVLEVYLPYAPISHDVATGMHVLYRDLAVGLALLWLVLVGISLSLSRGLRRQVRLNAYLAEHDTLTDLPNRALFHTRAKAALDESRRGERAVVIAIIDLDRFKEVNDTLGHNNGDLLLTELARRLAANTHPTDTVARLGGDEFGVILYGAVDGEATLWRLREVIDQQMEVNSLPLSVEASVGFVVAPEDGTDVDVLLQRADVAMYVAKSQHAGVVRYDAQQDHYDATNLALIGELRHAIEADQLVLHYQPKTSVDTGSVDAVEALVRWQHPSLGLLHPARFLPLAEQTELIDRLTTWVLNRALAELRGLGSAAADLGVAVNVSARNLSRPDFAHEVISLLERHGVAANRLIIEITETSLLLDPPRAALILAQLATAGVKVSLDDFGCGQTSFGYLSALTIHELKIDRSFVADMLVNRAHAAIVRSIIDLGHNLSLQVVGEGVETDDTLEGLRAAGCDVVQGFLVARPMPVERLRVWLAGRPLRPARSPELTG
jgi:diguanylate cyclase (GGDEF)-like protein